MIGTGDTIDAKIISYGVEFIEGEDIADEIYESLDIIDSEERKIIKRKLHEFSNRPYSKNAKDEAHMDLQ